MSAFRFETISVQDALNFATTDSLQFGAGGAAQASVSYAADHVTITSGGRSMDFGLGVEGQTGMRFADGSMLYVGGGGADSAVGTGFGDGLYGGAAADSLDGGDGADLLQGNQGDDSLAGGLGADVIYGGQDNDRIQLAAPNSTPDETNFANGNKGDDVITGGPGADLILGGQGSDVISGGGGRDFLNGNLGDDLLVGGDGDDTLVGEGGADLLLGGDGSDLFVFAAGSSDANAQVTDAIQDWGRTDRIHIEGAAAGLVSVTAPAATMGYYYGGYYYGGGPVDDGYSAMLGRANAAMAADPSIGVVAASVSGEVVLFADINGDHMADLAITLQGASLLDISAANLV